MNYLANAFSLSMLTREDGQSVVLMQPLTEKEAKEVVAQGFEFKSIVGHADTAYLFGKILGAEVTQNRESITLTPEDRLLVGQYIGPRLEPGTTELPPEACILWWGVTVTEILGWGLSR